jgi:hypothetical protein
MKQLPLLARIVLAPALILVGLLGWIAGYYEVVKMERGKKVCRKK